MNYVMRAKIKNPSGSLLQSLHSNSNIARFTYNWMLGYCLQTKVSPKDARNEFRRLVRANSVYSTKDGHVYPKDFQDVLVNSPSHITDMESDKLIQAFKSVKKTSVPSFRTKNTSKQSFTINRKGDSTFRLSNEGFLTIVKTGTIKLNLGKFRVNLLNYDIQRITITESAYGWYISILVRLDDNYFVLPSNQNKVGIDWGIKAFATDSDERQFRLQDQSFYKYYSKLYARRKELQSILSKKRNNNTNWKTSKKYARLKNKIKAIYEKMQNIRMDFLHDVSMYYIRNYGTINIENLKPSNLLKNHKLARVIAESMFYAWKSLLLYKARFYGRVINLNNPAFTSQTCSCCGKRLANKLSLRHRIFICPNCGFTADRDYNAAVNIKNLA